ncbi:hypothetical protein [Gordonia sp. ABSL49_1]|nr:hypothetical protein [Gordonia sp. ABSL49_1]
MRRPRIRVRAATILVTALLAGVGTMSVPTPAQAAPAASAA